MTSQAKVLRQQSLRKQLAKGGSGNVHKRMVCSDNIDEPIIAWLGAGLP